jgi:hypothetical protein
LPHPIGSGSIRDSGDINAQLCAGSGDLGLGTGPARRGPHPRICSCRTIHAPAVSERPLRSRASNVSTNSAPSGPGAPAPEPCRLPRYSIVSPRTFVSRNFGKLPDGHQHLHLLRADIPARSPSGPARPSCLRLPTLGVRTSRGECPRKAGMTKASSAVQRTVILHRPNSSMIGTRNDD